MKKRPIRSWVAAALVLSSAGLVGGWTAASTVESPPNALNVVVNPGQQYQTLEGWGTSLAWFAHIMGGAPSSVRDKLIQLLFNPHTGLGLNVVRYNIGGGENPKYHFLEKRAAIPGYEPSPNTWNWHADKAQRRFLKEAMNAGADQVEAFSNSPPYWMTVSGSVTGSRTGYTNNIAPSEYENFAHYLATVVEHFAQDWGITFRTLEPFNEPVSTWWKFGGTQEGCHISNVAQAKILVDLSQQLTDGKSGTHIAAPDDNSIDQTVTTWSSYPSSIQQGVSQINTHGYTGTQRTELLHLAQKAGADLWMSEYGDSDGTGLTMSEQILSDMKTMHANAWVYWQAVDDAPGWGFLTSHLNHETTYAYSFNEKYYVMANYSKFIRPGFIFINVTDAQSLAAYDPKSDTLVLVKTNDGFAPQTVSYNLTAFSHLGSQAMVYRTTRFGGTDNLLPLTPISVHHHRLTVVAPPFSVTTYVIQQAAYRPVLQTVVGARFSATKADKAYTTKFHGTGVWVYGNMGPSSGMATFHVAGQTSETLDLYAPSEQSHVLIYASPTLSDGDHQLTIESTGLHNVHATGTMVSVDRVAAVVPSGN